MNKSVNYPQKKYVLEHTKQGNKIKMVKNFLKKYLSHL